MRSSKRGVGAHLEQLPGGCKDSIMDCMTCLVSLRALLKAVASPHHGKQSLDRSPFLKPATSVPCGSAGCCTGRHTLCRVVQEEVQKRLQGTHNSLQLQAEFSTAGIQPLRNSCRTLAAPPGMLVLQLCEHKMLYINVLLIPLLCLKTLTRSCETAGF